MPRLSLPARRGVPAVPSRGREPRWPQRLLVGQAAAGLVVGLVWWGLTRRPPAWLVGEPVVTSSLTYPIARDGTFAVLGLLLGVVAGVLVLRHGLDRPLLSLTAALCGALAGSLLAAGTGAALPPSDSADPLHVAVTAWGVLLLWPLAVCTVVLLATLTSALLDWVRTPEAPHDPDVAGSVGQPSRDDGA